VHRVKIKYFASLKEKLGLSSEELILDKSLNIKDFREYLMNQKSLAHDSFYFRIAVNHDFASDDLFLKDGDEVALLPPVTGG
jgi:molybdopterin synthase sulfur carrier subunit